MENSFLSIDNLSVEFYEKSEKTIRVLNNISLEIKRGEIFGIIGESGAGKTVLAHSILGLLDGFPGIISGKIILDGNNILKGLPQLSGSNNLILKINKLQKWRKEHQRQMKKIWGTKIGAVFQEPFKSMDPLFTVREHLIESIKNNDHSVTDKTLDRLVLDWLKSVQLDNPEKIQNQYVFELSGGMIQRVMVATALASKPLLIIADEPTTALDTITQKKLLDLIQNKLRNSNQSLLFISHDLGIASHYFDRIAVIFGGRIIETGTKEDVTKREWRHPYTDELLHASAGRPPEGLRYMKNYISRNIPGCIFSKRCKYHQESCGEKEPPMIEVEKNHFIRCWKFC